MKLLITFFTLFLFSQQSFAQQAPNFSLKTSNGEIVNLADFKGQPTVIHFWATWCPYCKKLQPELNRLGKKYKDKSVNVVAISIWEDEGAMPQAVIDDRGHDFITLINGDKVADSYRVKGTPTTIFIDKNGEVIGASSASDPSLPLWEQAFEHISSDKKS